MLSALVASSWAYPALEVVHLLGVALLIGNLAVLEARVFGAAPSLPVAALARLSLTLAICGFAVAAASGLLMFTTQAAELLANRAFVLKMVLLFVAGSNAAWFHGRGSLRRMDALARGQLVFSGLLWLIILALGRWIAYI